MHAFTLLKKHTNVLTPSHIVNGNTIDISEWLDCDFYDLVWYWDQRKMDTTDKQAQIG